MDERSFESFYEEAFSKVVAACAGFAGTSDAHDLAQEAFVKTWMHWDRVSSQTEPVAYTLKVAANLSHRWWRRGGDTRYATPSADTEPGGGLRPTPTDTADLRMALERSLLQLPRRERQCVVLTDVLGYPATEAARILGIRPSTARVHVARGRERLRVLLRSAHGWTDEDAARGMGGGGHGSA